MRRDGLPVLTCARLRAMKVVTFLGIARYDAVRYELNGRDLDSQVSAHALAKLLGANRIQVLATDAAWAANGEELSRLCRESDLLPPEKIEVPDTGGADWELFDELAHALSEDVETVLDISNGWRSMPFFGGAALAYREALDRASSSVRVFYSQVFKDTKTGVFHELAAFQDLLRWTQALSLFVAAGRLHPTLDRLARQGAATAGAEWSRTRAGPPPKLKRLAQALVAFGQDLEFLRLDALVARSGPALVSAVEQVDEETVRTYLPALRPLLGQIADMARFPAPTLAGDAGWRSSLEVAALYRGLGRPLASVGALREGVVSALCQDPMDKVERARVERALHDHPQWRDLGQMRNDLLHGGMRPSPQRVGSLRAGIDRVMAADRPTLVFVNLSNHPLSGWGPEQLSAAEQLASTLVDVPFPRVPPQADGAAVQRLADQTVASLPKGTVVVHLAGEPTLVVALLARLRARKLRVVCSTTERQVDADGARVFRFVRFRDFP